MILLGVMNRCESGRLQGIQWESLTEKALITGMDRLI